MPGGRSAAPVGGFDDGGPRLAAAVAELQVLRRRPVPLHGGYVGELAARLSRSGSVQASQTSWIGAS